MIRTECWIFGHDWPRVPSLFSEVRVLGPQRDRCGRCGEVRIIHADGSRTYIFTEDVIL